MENQISLDRLRIFSLSFSNRKKFDIKIREIFFSPDKKDGICCKLSIFVDEVKIECYLQLICKGISDKNYSYLLSFKDFIESYLLKNSRLQEICKNIAYNFNKNVDLTI